MKKYVSFGVLSLALLFPTFLGAESSKQELEAIIVAIEMADVAAVENFLQLHTLNKKEKKELLEKATTVLEQKLEELKLLKNAWSKAKYLSGITLTVLGYFVSKIGNSANAEKVKLLLEEALAE